MLQQFRTRRYKCRKPWIPRESLQRINKKNRLFEKFQKSRDNCVLLEYKQFRNALNRDIKKAKSHYHDSKFNNIQYDPKRTWKALNSIIKPNFNHTPLNELQIGSDVSSGRDMTDAINDYFINVGAYNRLNTTSSSIFSRAHLEHTIMLNPVTSFEVEAVIKSLKNKSACGDDNIKAEPIEYVPNIISEPLQHIMNLIFETGSFPHVLKTASNCHS